MPDPVWQYENCGRVQAATEARHNYWTRNPMRGCCHCGLELQLHIVVFAIRCDLAVAHRSRRGAREKMRDTALASL